MLTKPMIKTMAVIGLILSTRSLTATSGMLQIGSGVKSVGMGGVGIALPQDAFASQLNPAGLTYLGGRLDAALQINRQKGAYVLDGDGVTIQEQRSREWMFWPEAGLTWSARSSRWPVCHAFGLAITTRGEWGVSYPKPAQAPEGVPPDQRLIDFGDTPLSCNYHVMAITPAWAWKLNSIHSIGIGINALVGWFRAHGIERLSGDPQNRGYDTVPGISARIGWMGQVLSCLRLGVTYQTPEKLARFTKYSNFIPNHGNATLPSQLGFGVAWQICPEMLFAADVAEVFWRNGTLFRNTQQASGPYGAHDGPGLGWRSQFVFKLGFEWEIVPCLSFRGGWHHGNTPPAFDQAEINILVLPTLADHVTLGFTYVCGRHEFSFAYIHGFEHTLRHTDTVTMNQLGQPDQGANTVAKETVAKEEAKKTSGWFSGITSLVSSKGKNEKKEGKSDVSEKGDVQKSIQRKIALRSHHNGVGFAYALRF